MNIAAIVLILLVPALLLSKESAKITPLVLTSLLWTMVLVGYAKLDAANGTHVAWLCCGAEVCLVAGYYSYRGLRRAAPLSSPRVARAPRRSAPHLVWFFAAVVGLAGYHLVAAGLPAFLDNVETARFDFNASGLFGIPGRMFLFGLPFLVVLVNLASGRSPRLVSRRLLYLAWASYFLVGILGGFKGGLFNVAIVLLLVRGIMGRPISLPRVAGGLRTVLILAALLFSGAMAFRYKSLAIVTIDDLVRYASTRATEIPAIPGYFAIGRYGTGGNGGQNYLQDARYFLGRYVPLVGPGPDLLLPLDKTISAALSGAPTRADAFIVPVTVGAFPESVVNFGAAGGLALMFLAGAVLSWAAAAAQASRRAWSSALLGFGVYMLQIYILNGNLMYLAFNFILVSLLLLLIYALCRAILRVLDPGNYPYGNWALGNRFQG